MHTDEFEISLMRELKVCGNTIKRIKKTLSLMEQKYTKATETFIAEYRGNKLDREGENKDDFLVWESSYESLQKWQDLERQYQQQLSVMRISVTKPSSQPKD
jgi:hypothetical protein